MKYMNRSKNISIQIPAQSKVHKSMKYMNRSNNLSNPSYWSKIEANSLHIREIHDTPIDVRVTRSQIKVTMTLKLKTVSGT
jgi:hypothetical protein